MTPLAERIGTPVLKQTEPKSLIERIECAQQLYSLADIARLFKLQPRRLRDLERMGEFPPANVIIPGAGWARARGQKKGPPGEGRPVGRGGVVGGLFNTGDGGGDGVRLGNAPLGGELFDSRHGGGIEADAESHAGKGALLGVFVSDACAGMWFGFHGFRLLEWRRDPRQRTQRARRNLRRGV